MKMEGEGEGERERGGEHPRHAAVNCKSK